MNLLTDRFDIAVLTHSDTAIKNGYDEQTSPPAEVVACLEALFHNTLLPLRRILTGKINVTCAYRCPRTNKAVGGKPNSQHQSGQAADIEYYEDTTENNQLIVDTILVNKIPFDQMIWENGGAWVHMSYREGNNRHQFLKL